MHRCLRAGVHPVGRRRAGRLVRGALQSIPKVQYESSYVLGLSPWQTFSRVILPQAVRRMLPASVNLATRIVKTTSLAVLLGVVEVIKVGQQIIDANHSSSRLEPCGFMA